MRSGVRRRTGDGTQPAAAAPDAVAERWRRWGLRQAARTYPHLPPELLEQTVAEAVRHVSPSGSRSDFAERLTELLRRSHADWCAEQPAGLWGGPGPGAPPDREDDEAALGAFIEGGLGGLQRAVLQLEIGAGRDSRTVRAALRLGPRQYARHRETGLAKIRDAIRAVAAGRVCEDHLHAVVLAATGDWAASGGLAAGPGRCRSCGREAERLRRVLHKRLAVAPWPLALGAGLGLATKLDGLTGSWRSAVRRRGPADAGAPYAAGAASVALVAAVAIATGGGSGAAAPNRPPDARPAPRSAAPTAGDRRRPLPVRVAAPGVRQAAKDGGRSPRVADGRGSGVARSAKVRGRPDPTVLELITPDRQRRR